MKSKEQIIAIACLSALLVCLNPADIQASSGKGRSGTHTPAAARESTLRAEQDETAQTIKVYRANGKEPILTQNARKDVRPYIHPIVAPDGHGIMTEYRPAHHLHQMGIYWGFKLLNGREFFMQWQGDHYRKVSSGIVRANGPRVQWQTVYDLLNESGNPVLTATQNWAMEDTGDKYILDLEWRGQARTEVILGKTYVGGLFVRIPWRPMDHAEAANSAGQRDGGLEQQRAIWTDVGIQVERRSDLGHIAIFDYPDNYGFPTPWRVDKQYGFGPNTEWTESKIDSGKERVYRYRLIVYGGDLNPAAMTQAWKQFVREFKGDKYEISRY